jgi:DNA repair photolyase
VPGFSTQPAKIEATVKAIADHGARFVGANLLFLDGGTRDHFMNFLGREFPTLVDQYDRLYAAKYAPKDYAERVRKTVGMLKGRYGLNDRKRRGDKDENRPAAVPAVREAQATFEY